MKKVFWFSRHKMTNEQRMALENKFGELDVFQVSKSIQHTTEVIDYINWADIIAIVAPIVLQAEFVKLAGDKPVIMAVSERILKEDGEVEFKFVKWERLVKVEFVKEDFA
jgi:hypothetical protein|nr:MAG TPA: hypothetical protein [Caudoviricetes sp.]